MSSHLPNLGYKELKDLNQSPTGIFSFSTVSKAHRSNEHARRVCRNGCWFGRSIPDPDRRDIVETKRQAE